MGRFFNSPSDIPADASDGRHDDGPDRPDLDYGLGPGQSDYGPQIQGGDQPFDQRD